MNFAGFGEDHENLLKQSYRENYNRMIKVKKEYDPLNLF
ncbi:MAG: hypothetical protein BAJALOKI1v1_70032 [Promethearchaeota archaeon]|nr:MAG: hypothetical protein BAJALOKI1v1_70032 [Candidatus Lokiarchaeota archaeon]